MQVKYVLAASVGGIWSVGLGSRALAAFQFTDVLDDGITHVNPDDAVPGTAPANATGPITGVSQVVVGPAGDIAVQGAVSQSADASAASNPAILYRPASGAFGVAAEVKGDTAFATGPAASGGQTTIPPWFAFNDVALSQNSAAAPRLWFVGQGSSGSTSIGVFQYDYNTASSSLVPQRVLYQGDTLPTSTTANFNTTGSAAARDVPYTVNAAGKMVFGVEGANSVQYIAQGDGAAAPTIITNGSAVSFTAFNTLPFAKQVSTPGGSAVFLAKQASNDSFPGIYEHSPGAGATQLASGETGVVANSTTYFPEHVYGATASDVLFLGQAGGQAALILQQGRTNPTYTVLGASFPFNATNAPPAAEITPGGKIAVLEPTATTPDLEYFDAAHGGASLAAPIPSGITLTHDNQTYTLTSFGLTSGSSPLVNERGDVVISAKLLDLSDGHSVQAFLDWEPLTSSSALPVIMIVADSAAASDGDFVTINGVSRQITALYDNSLASESDVRNSALNDSGLFALGVQYNSGLNIEDVPFEGTAVLTTSVTPVPEPAAIAMLLTLSPALIRRRRRRCDPVQEVFGKAPQC